MNEQLGRFNMSAVNLATLNIVPSDFAFAGLAATRRIAPTIGQTPKSG